MKRAISSLVLPARPGRAPPGPTACRCFSVQGADCAECADKIKGELKKTKGVGQGRVRQAEGRAHGEARRRRGRRRGRGRGRARGVQGDGGTGAGRLPAAPGATPPGADVQWLSRDGSAVGPLPKLRAAAKYTVFDVYADWCGPCRTVDERLRDIVAERTDVAVRKLNVVDFESPLGKELGSRLEALPYLIVFTPSGKRIDIAGADMEKLDKALAAK